MEDKARVFWVSGGWGQWEWQCMQECDAVQANPSISVYSVSIHQAV